MSVQDLESNGSSVFLGGDGGMGGAGGGAIILLRPTVAGGAGGVGGIGTLSGGGVGGGGGGNTFSPDCANVAEEHKSNASKIFVRNDFITNIFSRDAARVIFHKLKKPRWYRAPAVCSGKLFIAKFRQDCFSCLKESRVVLNFRDIFKQKMAQI